MKNFNKKNKKSYNTTDFDIDTLKDELIQKSKQQFSNNKFKSDKRKRR